MSDEKRDLESEEKEDDQSQKCEQSEEKDSNDSGEPDKSEDEKKKENDKSSREKKNEKKKSRRPSKKAFIIGGIVVTCTRGISFPPTTLPQRVTFTRSAPASPAPSCRCLSKITRSSRKVSRSRCSTRALPAHA